MTICLYIAAIRLGSSEGRTAEAGQQVGVNHNRLLHVLAEAGSHDHLGHILAGGELADGLEQAVATHLKDGQWGSSNDALKAAVEPNEGGLVFCELVELQDGLTHARGQLGLPDDAAAKGGVQHHREHAHELAAVLNDSEQLGADHKHVLDEAAVEGERQLAGFAAVPEDLADGGQRLHH